MSALDLEALRAAAQAAKDETGSGKWYVGTRHDAGMVMTGPGPITMEEASPCALAVPNWNFKYQATVAHIASADPDAVIALVAEIERLRAEADALKARVAELERQLAGADDAAWDRSR